MSTLISSKFGISTKQVAAYGQFSFASPRANEQREERPASNWSLALHQLDRSGNGDIATFDNRQQKFTGESEPRS